MKTVSRNEALTAARKMKTLNAQSSGGGGSAISAASFLVLGADAALSSERVLTPGAGLTGADGGAGSTYTLAVVSGNTGIVVNADDITLTLASNSGLVISSGLAIASTVAGAGLTWTSGVLDIVSGNTAIVVNANDITLTLAATSGLQISSGLMIADTVAGAGLTIASKVLAVGAGAGITVNADDVALTTPGTLTVATSNSASGSHTHAITSSSNPGAAAAILASTAAGALTLVSLTTTGGLTNTGNFTTTGTVTVASGASATLRTAYHVPATVTITGSTNITTATGFNANEFGQPTLSAASALTITNAATVYIAAAPTGTGAGPASITNAYALWIDAGASRFDGQVESTVSTGTAPFIVASTTVVTNLNADLWDGFDSAVLTALAVPQYVTLATTAALTNERVLTAGAGLTLTDGGAGSTVTIDVVSGNTGIVVNANDITLTLNATSGLEISTGLRIADSIAGAGLTIASKVLAVGAGSGITVNADDVALAVPGVMSVASLNSAAGATAAVPTVVSGTAVSTSAAAASLAVTIDGSAAAGHKLFCVVATRGNTVTVNTPDGWELQETVAQTNVTMTVFSRIARTGDASSTVTLTFTGSVNAAAVIIRSPDAIAGEFVNIDGSNTNASSTSVVINSVTTTLNNCLMIAVSTWASAASCTVDASTTELVEKVSTDASNNVGLNVAYYTQATAGATGSKTHTLGSGAGQAVGQIAVIPVTSGGHQHYIGATYRPGNASAVLRTDASGYLGLLRLGVGSVVSPSYPLHARATTEQMRLEYDSTYYTSFTVASNGSLTVDSQGTVQLLSSGNINLYAATAGANIVSIVIANSGTITMDTRNVSGGSASLLNKTTSTNATQTSLTIDTETTGTAAAGLGGSALFRVEDNGGTVRSTGYLSFTWTVATAASRSGKFALAVYDVSTANELLTGASNAGVIITQPVRASTTSPAAFTVTGAAHTTANLAEIIDINFNLARTVQFSGGLGDLATQRAFVIQAPTYAFSSAQTITTASTVSITGAPVAGTNATITSTRALTVETGNVYIDDGALAVIEIDAVTSGVTVVAAISHNSSGTPAAGFGVGLNYAMESTTTADTIAAGDEVVWSTATHASRKATWNMYVYDTSRRAALSLVSDGAAANIGFYGGSSFGGGSKVVSIPNAGTNPSSNPSGGGILYSDAGAGKWRGSSGTTTTFGPAEPHCPRCGRDYVFEAVNESRGEHIAICFACLVKELDAAGIDRRRFMITDKLN